MAKLGKTTIVISIIMVLCFIAGGVLISIDLPYLEDMKIEMSDSKTISGEGISAIDVDVYGANVNIIPAEGDEIVVDFSGMSFTDDVDKQPSLKVVQETGKLFFSIERPSNIGILGVGMYNMELDVYVPEETAYSLTIESLSGNLDVGEVRLADCELSLRSGNIKFAPMEEQGCDIGTISGNIVVGRLTGLDNEVSSTSGNIVISALSGAADVDTVSGNIIVKYSKVEGPSEISARSGSIEIHTPDDASYSFSAETRSGVIGASGLEVTMTADDGDELAAVKGDGLYSITAKTISGNIDVD